MSSLPVVADEAGISLPNPFPDHGAAPNLPLMLPHPESAVLNEDTFNNEVIRLLDGGGGGKCLRCGRTFSLFNSARRHFKTVHLHGKLVGETPVKCDLCHKTFRNDMSLKYHLRQTHSIYQK